MGRSLFSSARALRPFITSIPVNSLSLENVITGPTGLYIINFELLFFVRSFQTAFPASESLKKLLCCSYDEKRPGYDATLKFLLIGGKLTTPTTPPNSTAPEVIAPITSLIPNSCFDG